MHFNIDVLKFFRENVPFQKIFFIGIMLIRNFRCYHFGLHKRRDKVSLKQAVTKHPTKASNQIIKCI